MLLLRGIRPRTALISAGAIFAVLAVVLLLANGAATDDPAAAAAEAQRTTEALRGSPGTLIAENLRNLPTMKVSLSVQGPASLAAFLVGLAAGKRRLIADPSITTAPALRRVQLVGFPVGLAGAFVLASMGGPGETSNTVPIAVTMLTAPFLTAAYVATALRVFRSPRGRDIAARLAPAGRMALSNYLGQSLLCVLIFTGYGFRLAGQLTPWAVLLTALVIFTTQLTLSARWLATHVYGPAEWLLRAVTHTKWPAWHRAPH